MAVTARERAAENVIPWEQIEPLIAPGMTSADLRDEILRRAGLSSPKYSVCTMPGWRTSGAPLIEALRHGAYIRRTEDILSPVPWPVTTLGRAPDATA